MSWFAFATLILAAVSAVLTLINLPLLRTAQRRRDGETLPGVSVLIPARDEEPRIERAVRAVLASRGVDVEVVVMDDHSSDRTPEIVAALAEEDPRVRLERAPELPEGWAGKPHACQRLSERARYSLLLFVDADVELSPDGVAQAARALVEADADLVSGFPRQRTGSFVEKLVIPLIHFVLMGYLPLIGMKLSRGEAFAAGCGQLILARRGAYRKVGGHAAVKTTFHDGIELPRAFRRAGLRTDLFDATAAASCRMYHDAREVVLGLAKNAHEGMGGPVAIWVWSVLLLGGHVLPFALAPFFPAALAAAALAIGTRLVLAARFRQSWLGALLHPFGVALLVAIQWWARSRRRSGAAFSWKDRVQIEA